jgi:hypothetical protein
LNNYLFNILDYEESNVDKNALNKDHFINEETVEYQKNLLINENKMPQLTIIKKSGNKNKGYFIIINFLIKIIKIYKNMCIHFVYIRCISFRRQK